MPELCIEEYSASIQQYRHFPQNSRRRRRRRIFLRTESRFGMLWLKYMEEYMSDIVLEADSYVQASHALAKAIAATATYKVFEQARDRLSTDAEARKMLDELEAAEQKAQLSASWGGLSERESKKLERMREETFRQPTILAFLEAQQSLIAELQELNRYMTEKLGIDLADMTKPQTGCCG